MTKFIGKVATFGMGKETTPGTAVTPTHRVPLEKKVPNIKDEYIHDKSDYGVIVESVGSDLVYKKGEPHVEGLVFDKIIGLFCMAALGSVSTSSDDPEAGVNTHTFSILNSAVHPTYTLAFKDPNRDFAFPYSKLKTFDITYNKRAFIKFSADFISQAKESDSNTAAYPTDENRFNSSHVSFKIADTQADLASASAITVENLAFKLEKDILEQDSLGNSEPAAIYNGLIKLSFEVELVFDSTTYQDYYEGGTAKAAELKITNSGVTIGTSTNPSLAIQFNKFNFTAMDEPYTENDLIRQKFTCKGHYKLSDSKALQMILINTESSY